MRFIGISVLAMLCRVGLLHAGLPFDIPPVSNVTMDGDAKDRADRGLAVDVLTNPAGRLFDPMDFSATARVGYDAAGLLVLVRVQDDLHDENAGDCALGENDKLIATAKLAVDPQDDPATRRASTRARKSACPPRPRPRCGTCTRTPAT